MSRIYTEIRISHKNLEEKELFEKMLKENIESKRCTDKVDYIRNMVKNDNINLRR